MKIAVDASSILVRSAGVKNYVWHWVRAMRAVAGDAAIEAFPFLGDLGPLDHERSPHGAAGTLWRIAWLYGVNVPGPPWLDWLHPGCAVFHASNQTRIPPRRMKLTATVHDLTALILPELHTPGNIGADRGFADRILKRADGLIAVSENTRQDAIQRLGIRPERIRTIYSGIPEAFFCAEKLRRPRPYVLFLGTLEPRKNLDTLLSAWSALPADVRAAYDLVIAGPVGWAAPATVARVKQEAVYLGYVPEDAVPGLVAGATAFAYPSLYEGFGFPVAQAMAAGVPVLTSNTSCLPEVAGDAALLVDPRSAAEIAAGLARLLTEPSLRERLAAAGPPRAARYRWETCARESLAYFREIAGVT
jgi:alpha-1,3-rhamnosyl/mannosyltransferase